MIKQRLLNPNLWIAVVLLVANGAAWVYALAPEGPAVEVEPRLAPDVAALRDRLGEGGHSGEPFTVEITDQEAAETIAWYVSRNPQIPFREPQVFINPAGILAKGVAEIAGLRVGVSGWASVKVRDGIPILTLEDLDVAGVAVPGFVQGRIQAEIDAQFSMAQELPLIIDELALEEGRAKIEGEIR